MIRTHRPKSLRPFFLTLLLFFSSCSRFSLTFKKDRLEWDDLEQVNHDEIIGHLNELSRVYRQSNIKQLSRPRKRDATYLSQVIQKIYQENELFFRRRLDIKFYIVKSDEPFYFSTPKGEIYLSTHLIKKYLNSEGHLYSLLSFELIRIEKMLYQRKLIIPVGYIDTRRMLYLSRLKIEFKNDVHKWSYYILQRLGFDPDVYLSWIQVINRNSYEFALQLGNVSKISEEEAKFKTFLVDIKDVKSRKAFQPSSSRFYSFINHYKRIQ